MKADKYNPYDFGVLKQGTWGEDGLPWAWEFDPDYLFEEFPRWLLKEPVLQAGPGPALSVYLRGLYSKKLTNQRLAVLVRSGKPLGDALGGVFGEPKKED